MFLATWSLHQPSRVKVVGVRLFTTRLRSSRNGNRRPEVWTSLQRASTELPGDRRTSAGPLSSPSQRDRVSGRNRSASCRGSWTSAPACVRHSCRTSRFVDRTNPCTWTATDLNNWHTFALHFVLVELSIMSFSYKISTKTHSFLSSLCLGVFVLFYSV